METGRPPTRAVNSGSENRASVFYKLLYVNGLWLSSHFIKRRCDDDDDDDDIDDGDVLGTWKVTKEIGFLTSGRVTANGKAVMVISMS